MIVVNSEKVAEIEEAKAERQAKQEDSIDQTVIELDKKIDGKINTYDTDVASNKYKLKSDPIPSTTLYDSNGQVRTSPKIFIGVALANSDGDWSIDYSYVGFTQTPIVTATAQSVGTALADKRFVSLNSNQPTATGCSGKLASSSSAGLLAAMTMVHGAGNVNIIAIGY